jgi:hypothetical protein
MNGVQDHLNIDCGVVAVASPHFTLPRALPFSSPPSSRFLSHNISFPRVH